MFAISVATCAIDRCASSTQRTSEVEYVCTAENENEKRKTKILIREGLRSELMVESGNSGECRENATGRVFTVSSSDTSTSMLAMESAKQKKKEKSE
jgi:hypothetical protein